MNIDINLIKELREKSGAGIMDCRKALEATNGDIEKAFDELRKAGAAKLAKRADRTAEAGTIGTFLHNGQILGVAVLNCETDFVAKSPAFQDVAKNIAMQVCSMAPKYMYIEDISAEDVAREKAIVDEELKDSGKPESIVQKMFEGKMAKFYEQVCLMEQDFIKDDSKKVKDLLNEIVSKTGEKIVLKSFYRITI